MSVVSWYTNCLLKKPYSTKMITSFFTFGLGDIVSQMIENSARNKHGEKSICNFSRFLKQATYGIIFTPYLHLHFAKIVPFIVPESTNPNIKIRVIKRLLYDQTFHACMCTIAYFMYLNLVNHTGFNKAVQNTKEVFVPTMIANWKLWPAAMLINYSIMPQHYSVFYVNILSIFWNAYISYVFNRKKDSSKML